MAEPPPLKNCSCGSVADCCTPSNPPWVEPDAPMPEIAGALSSELFVAGALSTMPPFDRFHPAWALPFARKALDALTDWDPDE